MIIYGKQVCLYALTHHAERIRTVYIAKKGIVPHDLYVRFRDRVKFLENRWAQAMSKGGNHQGLLLEIDPIEPTALAALKSGSFLVVLDGLTDAGNIGAIARTAYALGADGIVATGIKQLNAAAMVRTSAGALLDLPYAVVSNPLDALHELKQVGFVLYGASMEGEPVETITFEPRRALILGSEDRGVSKKVQAKLDTSISIPMQRAFDSLNVSAAAAILLHRMSDVHQ
jgi:23S rRNA (guanosine2251-2'-O)-methyltransferase